MQCNTMHQTPYTINRYKNFGHFLFFASVCFTYLVLFVSFMTQLFMKKARSIQELARKKFERLRSELERSEKELKSEQKTRSNSLIKKPVKKPFGRTSQEPVGSDFSTGATLATIGDVQNGSNLNQGGSCERPSNTDGVVEGNPSLIDTNLEKAEELSSGIIEKVFPFYHYVQQ
jgi:hypothetical protein